MMMRRCCCCPRPMCMGRRSIARVWSRMRGDRQHGATPHHDATRSAANSQSSRPIVFFRRETVTAFIVGVSGSPGSVSRSRALLELALVALERHGVGSSRLIDLARLPADALLGRRQDTDVAGALQAVQDATILVVSTPIYRATYSGLLKVFFDLLPQDALAGKIAVPIATGAGPGHLLAVDHRLRPRLARVGAAGRGTGSSARRRSRAPAAARQRGRARDGERRLRHRRAVQERRAGRRARRADRARRAGSRTVGLNNLDNLDHLDHLDDLTMIGIYYEHPHWFTPLFAELDRRGTPYELLHAAHHRFDPATRPPYRAVFNRMSPSAWQRGQGHAVFYTHHFLEHLERHAIRVVNGSRAFRSETSKALQLSILRALGLPYPPARVIHQAADAPAAASELRFPIVVKPNIGGSGAGVRRFDDAAQLAAAAENDELELGPDHTALVQEFIPAEEGRITRVEVLGGRFLYAIRVYSSGA